MSAPEGEPQGGRQTCWETGCESEQGEEPGSYGEKQVCDRGSQQPVREKGRQQPPVREKGEQGPACKKVEKSACEQKKASVSEEGEEGETDWKLKCERAWKLREDGIPTPENLDWKDIYHKKPFGRNLLKSSNPEGLSTNEPPPPAPADAPPPRMPLESYGDFSGWNVSTENIPMDRSGIPPGVVVCYLPNYRYEDSKLHQFVYELHVKLLGADKSTVIQEFSLKPEDSMSGDSTGWKHVSHIFKSYGPGVRYVHFMHKSKDLFVVGFHRTRLTDTSVFVKLRE
ncbi:F-box only protein 50 isoform X2 [Ambystoma mexicanum]|uniref:F-box only protein 50 isoform X2 n=1 Tax=Ambystoma mexicanum TaxID=8296 RepID=UPI0037E7BA45